MRILFSCITGFIYCSLASAGESLPLTDYRLAWLTLHDHPELLTDARLTRFTVNEVGIEAADWRGLPSIVDGYSRRQGSQVTLATYEWQTLIVSQPDLARGALLDVFMRPDAPWTFVPRPSSSVVAAFAFSRDSVKGRQADFAANELLPVSKQLLLLQAAKVPRDLYFDRRFAGFKYDFAAKAIRFPDLPGGVADMLKPLYDINSKEPQDREYFDGVPDKAKKGANHWIGSSEVEKPDMKPGFPSPSPSAEWRNHLMFLDLPPVLVLEVDRQLRITSIPIEAVAAERLQKAGPLSTRIYINAERIDANHLAHPERVNNEGMTLMAQLQKVEVMDAKGTVVATLKPDQLPPPMIIPAAVSAPAVSVPAPKRNREEQKAESMAAAHAARSEAMQEKRAKEKACRQQARDDAATATDRREAFHECMDKAN